MTKAKVGYLGPDGSYSKLAADKLCKNVRFYEFGNFFLLVDALQKGGIDLAVLPIENSVNGGVTQNIDLLQECDNTFAFKQCKVKIDHRLATIDGADLNGIKAIYSHGQALGQCARYIHKHYPNAELHETSSTASSLQMLTSPECAGIVGSHILKEGISLSKSNIADNKHIYTQFLLVKKINGRAQFRIKKSDKNVFFSFTCPHEPGALVKLLGILNEYNLNMTRIESRPIKEKVGEYRFFIEIEVGKDREKAMQALTQIRQSAIAFRLLGTY